MTEEKKVGYAVTLIRDYGNGHQVQIVCNMPVGATKKDFDEEFDKIRMATDRQRAFVTLKEFENKVVAEKQLVGSMEDALREDTKPTSTIEKQNLVAKKNELAARRGNLKMFEELVANAKKEIGDGV